MNRVKGVMGCAPPSTSEREDSSTGQTVARDQSCSGWVLAMPTGAAMHSTSGLRGRVAHERSYSMYRSSSPGREIPAYGWAD